MSQLSARLRALPLTPKNSAPHRSMKYAIVAIIGLLLLGTSFGQGEEILEIQPLGRKVAPPGCSIHSNEFEELGKHWSGLDREALYEELARGEIPNASKRLSASAASSGRENADLLILIELESTDLFRGVRAQLIRLGRMLLEDQSNKRTNRESSSAILMRGLVQELLLCDADAALVSYEASLQRVRDERKSSKAASREDTGVAESFESLAEVRLRNLQRRPALSRAPKQ